MDESIKHVDRKEFADAESDLEKQYRWHQDDIGYCALLGIAQAANRQYAKADSTFRALIKAFESKPETIITIRDTLRPLFQTEAYKNLHKQLRNAAANPLVDLSNLYVVDGFLSLAEYRFDNASEAFAQVARKYSYKFPQYKALMDQLAAHFNDEQNTVAHDGYRRMSRFFQMYLPGALGFNK